MKPLIRWTIGNVKDSGWECFSESIRLLPKIYPEFDFIICYNNLDEIKLKKLKSFNIKLYEQKEENLKIPHKFLEQEKIYNHFWKLCPIRIRPQAHELWIDNDIIITDRIPEIDEWLTKDACIISTSYGGNNYGRFKSSVKTNMGDKLTYCAGLFGLPPNFNFEEKIIQKCKGVPLEGFDEQGVVASIVTESKELIPIDANNLHQTGWWKINYPWISGYHFIRLNTSTNSAWERYKMLTSPDPKINNIKNWMYHCNNTKKGTKTQQRLLVP